MVDTPQTIASKRKQYLRLMQKAQQLDDPELVKLILKRLAILTKADAKLTADRCLVIPLSTIQIPAKATNQDTSTGGIPASKIKIGSDKMDKKLLAFYCIAAALIIAGAFFLGRYFNPDTARFNASELRFQQSNVVYNVDHSQLDAPEKTIIGGTLALLLVGYFFWFFYRKFVKDNRTYANSLVRLLAEISSATGLNEYEIFRLSAENWSVSGDRINEDFKRYMAAQVLPYYLVDFIRKNHKHIDESLMKNEEVEPTSLWDWAKALLIFPGCFFLPLLISFIFGSGYIGW